MRYFIVILAFVALLSSTIAHAKRAQAAKVEPVVYDGVRYIAPNDNGRRGYIQAWDTKTNKLIWELTIYRNFINPFMEEDVQWVFIKKLSLSDGKLIVVDERDRTYGVDVKTRTVRRLEHAPTDKAQANKAPQATAAALRALAVAKSHNAVVAGASARQRLCLSLVVRQHCTP
jgi:hypothetical protein